MARNVVAVLLGMAAIAVGLFGNEFYLAKTFTGIRLGKPMPVWLGRGLFLAVGFAFVAFGLVHLLLRG
jgi:hypothetical protein